MSSLSHEYLICEHTPRFYCALGLGNVHRDEVNTSFCRSWTRIEAYSSETLVYNRLQGAWFLRVLIKLWLQNLPHFSFRIFRPDEVAFKCKCKCVPPPVGAGPSARILTRRSSGADRWRSAMTGCSESGRTIRSGRSGLGRSPSGGSPRTAGAAHTDALRGRTWHSGRAWLKQH